MGCEAMVLWYLIDRASRQKSGESVNLTNEDSLTDNLFELKSVYLRGYSRFLTTPSSVAYLGAEDTSVLSFGLWHDSFRHHKIEEIYILTNRDALSRARAKPRSCHMEVVHRCKFIKNLSS
jgi:hypothetical protein